MIKTTKLQQNILKLFLQDTDLQSSEVHSALLAKGEEFSLVSIKRNLSEMVKIGILDTKGGGRSTSYEITTLGRVTSNIDTDEYVAMEPDRRYGMERYNFNLFPELPTEVFDINEKSLLELATDGYQERLKNMSPIIQEKELQRLVIELSWKSSKIEGNTYTLLDTEKLILENKEAPGHDKAEAKMILNHKDAFSFIRKNAKSYQSLTLANLENLHSILVKNLGVNTGLRNTLVGVTGSKYKPLDNIYQIKEAVSSLSETIAKAEDPYTKAILALIGVSYIQPFEDGNKRTGRLMANALLLAHDCAPLSYRSVEEKDYRNSMLVFYETNSIVPFKKLFVDQYLFAAKNYAV